MNKEQVITDIINYYAGSKLPDCYNNEQIDIIAEYNRDWEDMPCDAEGANSEQDKAMYELLEKIAEKVLKRS